MGEIITLGPQPDSDLPAPQNLIERAVVLSRGDVLYFQPAELERLRDSAGVKGTLQEAERQIIVRTLDESRGVVGGRHGAAALLGVPRTTLISKMRRLGIAAPRPQSAGAGA